MFKSEGALGGRILLLMSGAKEKIE